MYSLWWQPWRTHSSFHFFGHCEGPRLCHRAGTAPNSTAAPCCFGNDTVPMSFAPLMSMGEICSPLLVARQLHPSLQHHPAHSRVHQQHSLPHPASFLLRKQQCCTHSSTGSKPSTGFKYSLVSLQHLQAPVLHSRRCWSTRRGAPSQLHPNPKSWGSSSSLCPIGQCPWWGLSALTATTCPAPHCRHSHCSPMVTMPSAPLSRSCSAGGCRLKVGSGQSLSRAEAVGSGTPGCRQRKVLPAQPRAHCGTAGPSSAQL